MSNFVVDVESDGPCPGLYSMVCFGAVLVDDDVFMSPKTFYGQTTPITDNWIPEALAVSGFSREQHNNFQVCNKETLEQFNEWILSVNKNGRPVMWSDNIAYDWQFVNYYFHKYLNNNPFGYSGRRIGDYYCGLKKDLRSRWKHLRGTKHDHNPVNDALGNAEAMLKMGIRN